MGLVEGLFLIQQTHAEGVGEDFPHINQVSKHKPRVLLLIHGVLGNE
jgi:hypothetical protein